MIGLFCRISYLLHGSFTKATYNFKEPDNRSHPIAICSVSGNVEYENPYAMYIATYIYIGTFTKVPIQKTCTNVQIQRYNYTCTYTRYGVATSSRLLKITGLFRRISSLL